MTNDERRAQVLALKRPKPQGELYDCLLVMTGCKTFLDSKRKQTACIECTMMRTRLPEVLTFLLVFFASDVNAFPTGAGGCSEGGPAVGGAHLTASAILKPTDLAAGKFDLFVNGVSLIDGDASDQLETDTDLTIEIISNMHQFKGALMRVYSDTGSLAFEPGRNAGTAFACDLHERVEGITHTNAAGKTKLSGILRVSDEVEKVKLEVTLVIATNEILSLHLYQAFDLQFAKTSIGLSSQVPSTTPPNILPTAIPTHSPSLTTPQLSTAPPTTSFAATTSPTFAANPTARPMAATALGKTRAPSPNPSKNDAIGSAEEPTSSAVTERPSVEHVVTNIQMDFTNVTSLSVDEILRLESLTQIWFKAYFDENGPITLISTTIILKSRIPVQMNNGNGFALRLVYDQVLEYELDEDLGLRSDELVLLPFREPEWITAYVELLKDPIFTPNLIPLGDSIDVPIVKGEAKEQTVSRRLTNGLVWMVVAICFTIGIYICYKLLINNRGGLKVQDFAPDTFSFIGSETSRRFGDAA